MSDRSQSLLGLLNKCQLNQNISNQFIQLIAFCVLSVQTVYISTCLCPLPACAVLPFIGSGIASSPAGPRCPTCIHSPH